MTSIFVPTKLQELISACNGNAYALAKLHQRPDNTDTRGKNEKKVLLNPI